VCSHPPVLARAPPWRARERPAPITYVEGTNRQLHWRKPCSCRSERVLVRESDSSRTLQFPYEIHGTTRVADRIALQVPGEARIVVAVAVVVEAGFRIEVVPWPAQVVFDLRARLELDCAERVIAVCPPHGLALVVFDAEREPDGARKDVAALAGSEVCAQAFVVREADGYERFAAKRRLDPDFLVTVHAPRAKLPEIRGQDERALSAGQLPPRSLA
jgi:hypothetical protein